MGHRLPDTRSAFGRQHEEALVYLIEPARRARFKQELKKAAAGRASIAPEQAWDKRWILDVRGLSRVALERTLRSRGAPDRCWAISRVFEADPVELALGDAINQVFADKRLNRSLISCIPGRLAYYDDRDDYIYWILERVSH